MGQKVNPVGMRVGVNRDWNSRWFAGDKEFHVFLNQDIKVRKYLEGIINKTDAGLSHIEIERTHKSDKIEVIISLFVARPGVLRGEDSKTLKEFEEAVRKLLPKDNDVKILTILVNNPNLDANIVAKSIARELENRVSFRVAQKKAIANVRRNGAKGIRTVVSGRLGGADIARSEGYKDGIIPLHTLRSDIDYALAEAATQYGQLGVKVWICRGEIRPELAKKEEKGE